MDHAEAVRAYYAALDEGDYEALRAVLAPGFVQRRPDRTFEGREAFVRFMRDDRPVTGTTHEIDALYRRDPEGSGSSGAELIARGRLLGPDGDPIVGFADAFALEDGSIVRLETYTR